MTFYRKHNIRNYVAKCPSCYERLFIKVKCDNTFFDANHLRNNCYSQDTIAKQRGKCVVCCNLKVMLENWLSKQIN